MYGPTIRRAPRTIVCFAAAAATLGVGTGCGSDDKKSSAKPASFAIEATAQGKKHLKLTFPSTVKAGLVTLTLKNSDKQPRGAQIVRVVGDHSLAAVMKVVDSNADNAPIPEWVRDGGGVEGTKPGQTASATQNLAPGRYVIWDDSGDDEGPSNASLGAKGEFTVTGDATDDALPSTDATVTATDKGEKDYGFSFKGLKAGTNEVRFENTGKQLHHAQFFPLQKGKSYKDVKKFLNTRGRPSGPPPIDFEKGVGTSVIDSGIAQNITLDLPAGKYTVLCFLPDRDGGKSHFEKGMIKDVEVK